MCIRDSCLGSTVDNDGDGLCDASTTCTNGTGAFNSYSGTSGASVLQSFATTFINGPFDNALYTDHVADIVGYSTNKVYVMDPATGLVSTYIFNNGWHALEFGGDLSGLNIVGVNGGNALVLEGDGSIDVYSLGTGAKTKDNSPTACDDGPLAGTAFSALTILGATSNLSLIHI